MRLAELLVEYTMSGEYISYAQYTILQLVAVGTAADYGELTQDTRPGFVFRVTPDTPWYYVRHSVSHDAKITLFTGILGKVAWTLSPQGDYGSINPISPISPVSDGTAGTKTVSQVVGDGTVGTKTVSEVIKAVNIPLLEKEVQQLLETVAIVKLHSPAVVEHLECQLIEKQKRLQSYQVND